MSGGGYHIRINLRDRHLYLYQGEQLQGSYLVAIGKQKTPSPVGKWKIANKRILSGGTVLGTRWMGLNYDTYGIHGNNNPSAIGKAVSLGCIRMYNHDVEGIFSLVPIGTDVEIIAGTQGSGHPLPPYQPPAQGNPQGKIYVIKKGDTLWEIAKRYGTTVQKIIELNPRINPDLIYPGDVIYLP